MICNLFGKYLYGNIVSVISLMVWKNLIRFVKYDYKQITYGYLILYKSLSRDGFPIFILFSRISTLLKIKEKHVHHILNLLLKIWSPQFYFFCKNSSPYLAFFSQNVHNILDLSIPSNNGVKCKYFWLIINVTLIVIYKNDDNKNSNTYFINAYKVSQDILI